MNRRGRPIRDLAGATRRSAAALAAAWLLLAGATAWPAQQAAAKPKVGLFGYLEFASDQLTALPLWRDALARIAAEREKIARCDADVSYCGSTALTVWRAKVAEIKTLAPMEQLLEINRFVNKAAAARSDAEAYDKDDYWAAPLQFLEHGGDAEDFAIMKFVSLRDAGVANRAMRISVVYDVLRQRRHAVLTVTLDQGTFILDTVSDAVLPADRVRFYVPYYSVNETTRWAYVVRPPQSAGG